MYILMKPQIKRKMNTEFIAILLYSFSSRVSIKRAAIISYNPPKKDKIDRIFTAVESQQPHKLVLTGCKQQNIVFSLSSIIDYVEIKQDNIRTKYIIVKIYNYLFQ